MSQQIILIIGLTYPEPTTTAAGIRMMQVIQNLIDDNHLIHFATQASETKFSFNLNSLGIICHHIEVNDSSFDNAIKEINPDIVIYDRFIMEEQFGWRVTKSCPNALTVLDTEDLHFLRKERQQEYKKITSKELYSDDCLREIASIMRCDYSFIISEFEYDYLINKFNILPSQLIYLPIHQNQVNISNEIDHFIDKKDFFFVGNFLHKPNFEACKILVEEIWGKIHQKLPNTELHLYGAYSEKYLSLFNQPKKNIHLKGWTPDINSTIKKYRVGLFPIPFGAGLKGKVLSSFENGTPIVTTPIGAEGIEVDSAIFGGYISDINQTFINLAHTLYTDENIWEEKRKLGYDNLSKFSKIKFQESLSIITELTDKELINKRKNNLTQQLLQHHTMKATEYMSRWIEEKNKSNR